jgi:hypothetical protein
MAMVGLGMKILLYGFSISVTISVELIGFLSNDSAV